MAYSFIPPHHWLVIAGDFPGGQLFAKVKRYAMVHQDAPPLHLAVAALALARDKGIVYEIVGPGGSVWIDHASDVTNVMAAFADMLGQPSS